MDEAVVEQTASALLVYHLYLHEGHVRPVGLHSFGIAHGYQPDGEWLSGRHPLIAASVAGHCLYLSAFEGNILEGEQILMAALPFTHALSVDKELHLVCVRYDVDGFACAAVIVPVANDMCMGMFGFHPSVPHHLVDVECILGQSHGVHHSARAEV